jgi:hypothetical protein
LPGHPVIQHKSCLDIARFFGIRVQIPDFFLKTPGQTHLSGTQATSAVAKTASDKTSDALQRNGSF